MLDLGYAGRHQAAAKRGKNDHQQFERGRIVPNTGVIRLQMQASRTLLDENYKMLLEKYGTVRMFGKFRGFHVRDGSEDGEFIADTGTDANTEADARAKMLIYLLENKVITLSN